jgi:hydroxyacylglutathione hydrolase
MADEEQETERIVREYFAALGRAEADAPRHFYAHDGRAEIHGVTARLTPAQAAEFFAETFAAFPDWRFEVLEVVAQGERAAVRWHASATFAGPGRFQGLEPTGARVDLTGLDLIELRSGRILRNDAYLNGADLARQLGALPPAGSAADRRLTGVVNARTRASGRIAGGVETVADGVWLLRGGFPAKEMNVFLVRDGDGVLAFDAGIRQMTNAVAAAGAGLGGLTRVVLGHSHSDHRGTAPGLGVPVLCHRDERADAEGDGGAHYFDFARLSWFARPIYPHLLRMWDGGPVAIAQTLEEGDDVAGFEVVHIPGHAPGMIALWRASDRLALTTDGFYVIDPQTGRHGAPRVPHPAFNRDTEQARASIRKLAALHPASAWPGHAGPLTGDVAGALEHAADTT